MFQKLTLSEAWLPCGLWILMIWRPLSSVTSTGFGLHEKHPGRPSNYALKEKWVVERNASCCDLQAFCYNESLSLDNRWVTPVQACAISLERVFCWHHSRKGLIELGTQRSCRMSSLQGFQCYSPTMTGWETVMGDSYREADHPERFGL